MIFIFLTVYVTLWQSASGANILYVAPFPSLSHYQMLEPLMLALARRGHQITVLSHYPRKDPVANYTDVDLRGSVKLQTISSTRTGFIENFFRLFTMSSAQCDSVVGSAAVQEFLAEDRRFDLLFLEIMATDCYLGFVKRYPAPFVLVNSQPLGSWLGDWINNPTEGSYVPDPFCRIGGRMMDLTGRCWNVFCQTMHRLINRFYNVPLSVEIARKRFRMMIESFEDAKGNASMIFVNSFPACSGVRPVMPNVVELAGIHIAQSKPIPDAIREFLDEATEGVIVFTLGSMVRADTLNPRLRELFVRVFRELNQRVLWKWESHMEEKSPNVMTVDWIPQSDVLGHEKVKLFIYHGGQHGVIEAAHHGVPVLGLPLYGDQEANIQNLEMVGMAKRLDFDRLNFEVLSSSIREMIGNRSYAENAKRISAIMRDRPVQPLDLAIFWTEYLLRNGPVSYPGTRLTWFEYRQIDVIVFIVSLSIAFILSFRLMLNVFLSCFFRLTRT